MDFPGYSGEGSLEEIEWDEWFEDFDNNNLALIVQDEMANGEQSDFNKLVGRERVEGQGGSTNKKSSTQGTAQTKASSTKPRKTPTTGEEKRSATSTANGEDTKSHHPTKRSRKKEA